MQLATANKMYEHVRARWAVICNDNDKEHEWLGVKSICCGCSMSVD